MNTLSKTLLLALYAGTLTACGGGSDTVTNPAQSTPPPTNSGPTEIVAVGPISNFGSIVVNGVRYETDSATFMIDDEVGSQSDLSVGQIVSVKGTVDASGSTGTANTVLFDDVVKGPVQSVDIASQSLVVLGQTVLVVADTSFDDSFSPASLDGVSTGQIVEVSGQFDANGDIVASRIEPKPAGTQFEVHGTVSNHDAAAQTFNLAALVVDYGSAILDDFPGGMIANGDFVEAKGMSLGGAGELLATKVELESAVPGAGNGDFVEVEGFISRFVSAEDFDVGMQPVTTTSATVFEGGSAADLGLNIKVEVEGVIDADGILVAEKVDIRRARAVRITANVDSVDSGSSSVVILGITIKIDAQTRMEDKSDADLNALRISDINAGDYLEVRGIEFPAESGEVLAGRLEREDPDDEAILQGHVSSFDGTSLVILGVTIDTNSGTQFEDAAGNAISAADFFARLNVNMLIKAKGTEVSDSTIVAREVEFEMEF